MAFPALSTALSTQRPAGVKKVYIKTGSEKWQTLGNIRNGEVKLSPYVTNDTYQRNLSIDSYTFEAKFEMLQTAVGELEKIDAICDGSNSFLFQLTDAGSIPTSVGVTEGWVIVSNTQVGVKAKYVTDGNPSSNQYVEIMIKGSLSSSEVDACVKASIDDGDFHISTTASETYSDNNSTAGGTIFGYYPDTTVGNNVGVLGNQKPNGFATVELQDALATTYVTQGRVRNGKINAEWLAEEDSIGRYNVYGIDLTVEYELLPTDAATLLLMNTANLTNTDVKITLKDGKVFTIASALGFQISFDNSGDFDKLRSMKVSHKGRILTSQFDGMVA